MPVASDKTNDGGNRLGQSYTYYSCDMIEIRDPIRMLLDWRYQSNEIQQGQPASLSIAFHFFFISSHIICLYTLTDSSISFGLFASAASNPVHIL